VSLVGTNPDPEDGQTQYDELLPEAVDHMVASAQSYAVIAADELPGEDVTGAFRCRCLNNNLRCCSPNSGRAFLCS
jgi:hypothetical protein